MTANRKKVLLGIGLVLILSITGVSVIVFKTFGRTVVRIDIHQNQEIILLSTFAEPPQFAIWLEDPSNHERHTVFVTRRAGTGDWEGKAEVPVALPRWVELFPDYVAGQAGAAGDESQLTITGATPQEDYFSIYAEVKPESRWICWIEMNLAGDFNEAFPEYDVESREIDGYSCGQPALLYRSEIIAEEGLEFDASLAGQSVWEDGLTRVEPVGDGVTSAREVFDEIRFVVMRPKPKLIE